MKNTYLALLALLSYGMIQADSCCCGDRVQEESTEVVTQEPQEEAVTPADNNDKELSPEEATTKEIV